ncbi:MAG: BlaI/MecI/CopY family transcriptional regulator [Candidatus Limnocylindria bacterium]
MTERPPRLNQPSVGAVLGPLGAAVMRVLWTGDETPLGSLIEQLSSERRTPAYTTVTTILTRLRERGLVERTRRGREAVYRAAVSERQLIEASSSRAVDELITRYGASAMRHFAERLADADPELRRQLIDLAQRRRSPKARDER